MSTFKDKISNLINSQAPDFVVEDHPYFLEFVKAYYSFLECAELKLTNIGDPDHIRLETQTTSENFLQLSGTNQQGDDGGDRILLEDTSYGDFVNGEIVTGQSSGATATILVEDIDNGSRLFVTHQNKFIEGELIIGSQSQAEATILSYRANPVQNIQQLLDYPDPDKTIQSFLTKFRNAFLQSIPDELDPDIDKRKLIKNIKSLYQAKGTKRASEIFFKLLFNEEANVRYPKENILRVSDGKWDTQKVLRCKQVGEINPTFLVGQTITQANLLNDSNVNLATAIVENVIQYTIRGEQIVELILGEDSISGTFVVGQNITGVNNTDPDVLVTCNITGIISDIEVNNDGAFYNENDNIEISGGGFGALVQVETIGSGSITEVVIDDGGQDYEIGDTVNFSFGNATAKVSVVNGGFTQEESSSTVDDHIVLEDETVRGDPYTGNKIVQESGTGTGDITDIRMIYQGNGYSALPTLSISTTSGTGAQIYAYGSEIGRILSLRTIELGADYDDSPTPPTLLLPTYLFVKDRTGTFLVGETITGEDSGGNPITAIVSSLDTNTNILKCTSSTGTFAENTSIQGNTSLETATIFKNDQATATPVVNAVTTTDGRYINQDGWVSESSMRIQDSLLYQDYSYIINVGRSISEWRDTYTKTLHPSGFYFQGEVSIVSQANARLRTVTGINSSITEVIYSLLNTLFSTILRRKMGTIDDGTTLRANPNVGTGADLNPATRNHFDTSTRDVTLKRTQNFKIVSTPKYQIRNDIASYGSAYAGPRMGSLQRFWRYYSGATSCSTGLTFADLNNHRLTGTLTLLKSRNRYNGEIVNFNEYNKLGLRTYLAFPTEITNPNATSFDEDGIDFSSTTETFDSGRCYTYLDGAANTSATYILSRSAASVDEGSSVTITLTTTNVSDGTNVPYTITGIDSADLSSGSLTGNFTINSNTASVTLTLDSDLTTEGAETLTLSLDNGRDTITVTVNDTSTSPPFTYEGDLQTLTGPPADMQTVTDTPTDLNA